jgi:cation transport ATPase
MDVLIMLATTIAYVYSVCFHFLPGSEINL